MLVYNLSPKRISNNIRILSNSKYTSYAAKLLTEQNNNLHWENFM
jgi:hypothetical protein